MHHGVPIGEPINLSMEVNAFLHRFGQAGNVRIADEVGDDATKHESRIGVCQVQVRQEIHR
jgi:hypothetical protein